MSHPSQRAASALRFWFARYAERRANYHAPSYRSAICSPKWPASNTSIKSLPRDIIDQQIEKNPIRADLHERLWRLTRRFMKAGIFAVDQYHRLTYATGRQGASPFTNRPTPARRAGLTIGVTDEFRDRAYNETASSRARPPR